VPVYSWTEVVAELRQLAGRIPPGETVELLNCNYYVVCLNCAAEGPQAEASGLAFSPGQFARR
jgi:hypothetical protein